MDPSLPELLLDHSRIAPNGNGNPSHQMAAIAPTDNQKLWAAVVLGFVFALMSSPLAYNLTDRALVSVGFASLVRGKGPELRGLLFRTILFVLVVRILLW